MHCHFVAQSCSHVQTSELYEILIVHLRHQLEVTYVSLILFSLLQISQSRFIVRTWRALLTVKHRSDRDVGSTRRNCSDGVLRVSA